MKNTTVTDHLPAVPWARVENFVGQLTHDIRNGLNALELQLTFLGEVATDPEMVSEVKELRNTLANVTRQLQALRTAMGAVTPYPLQYPVEDFFDDLRERLEKLHPAATNQFVWKTDFGAELLLAVDPELTINALLELLVNGLHFTREDAPPMRVQIFPAGDKIVFSLQESQPEAPPITPEEWGRTPLLTTRRGAYGLGLFRVRRCLESQGGTLAVEHSTERQTLTTKVMLPGVPPAQP